MSEATVCDPPLMGSGAASKSTIEAPPQQRKYLPEVQGLRALAVLMVVSYHVWFGRISGGVDVFLLLSAFLLTGQFARKMESGKPLGLLKYWIKLAARLLPMAAITLVATLGATYLFLPASRWNSVFDHTWASLFYYQNWFLASEAVDYYATDHSTASPLQHFWSLSIQGQVFILWPIIFAVAALVVGAFRLRTRQVLIWTFSGIFMASLAFSIMTTRNNQTFAYFDTRARLWEFALGSLLALVLPYLRLNRFPRFVLGWFGILAMLSCGLILQVGQQFPGYMALWPTLAAVCIIAAGYTGSRFGADRLLSARPLVKLGDSSYALYLLHWPILVIFQAVSGRDQAGPKAGLAVILVSIFLAWLLTRLVDEPLRKNRWIRQKSHRSLVVSLICLASVVLPLTVWQDQIDDANRSLLANASKNNPGAAALWPGYNNEIEPSAPLLPTHTALDSDWPVFPEACESDAAELINRCGNGIKDGAKSIVVLGSSHAHVLNTPLLEMAAANNWSITSITKGYCPLGTDPAEGLSDGCAKFNEETLEEVLDKKPDLVFTTSTRTNAEPEIAERLDSSWVEEVSTLNAAGIQVLAVRDTPRFLQPVPACLENNPDNYSVCSTPTTDLYSPAPPTDMVAPELTNTSFIDLTNSFCNGTVCPSVIGNVIVYKDDNHVTATYMRTLLPVFEQEFRAVTGWEVK